MTGEIVSISLVITFNQIRCLSYQETKLLKVSCYRKLSTTCQDDLEGVTRFLSYKGWVLRSSREQLFVTDQGRHQDLKRKDTVNQLYSFFHLPTVSTFLQNSLVVSFIFLFIFICDREVQYCILSLIIRTNVYCLCLNLIFI